MCQACFENQSSIFLALVPEMIEKAERTLESEQNFLARFEAMGDANAIARQRGVVDGLQGELWQLRNLQRSKGDMRLFDWHFGDINALGSQSDPRVLLAGILFFESFLETAKSEEDAAQFRTRIIILRSRLQQLGTSEEV